MTDEEKLIEGYKLLSRRSQVIVLAQVIAGAEMEENARRIALGGLAAANPLYTNPHPAPMGAMQETPA